MVKDPQLKVLVEDAHVRYHVLTYMVLTTPLKQVTCWMGPGHNIVGYCIVCVRFTCLLIIS
jgi:hypothetical protein